MTAVTGVVELSGPVFDKDPEKVMWQNIEKHYAELARDMAGEAEAGFRRGAADRPLVRLLNDRVADHVIGRVQARPSRGGRRWHAAAVVQVYNEGLSAAQSRSLMAAASRLEGRMRVIRDVTRRGAAKLRQIDLTKGLE